jgi:hypothetical protein
MTKIRNGFFVLFKYTKISFKVPDSHNISGLIFSCLRLEKVLHTHDFIVQE